MSLRITPETLALIDRALAEDVGAGDVTTESLVPEGLSAKALLIAKEAGVLAGIGVALAVFSRVDPELEVTALLKDGARLGGGEGDVVAEIEGRAASILTAERTALNFAQRLSGVATETSRYVEAVEGLDVRILDTRKTTPGLRLLEKYAVRIGGGHNHRRGLDDGVLIKDNHIHALGGLGVGLGAVVERARAAVAHTLRIEIEVEDLGQVGEALSAGADAILLDNMTLEDMAAAVELARGKAILEASGGITLDNVREVAATGVDLISVGALTHSVRSLDLGLDMV